MTLALRRAALVASLRDLPPHMRAKIDLLKLEGTALRQRPDLLWHLLLQSAATRGNSSGWQRLFGNPQLIESVSYQTLAALPAPDREPRILTALKGAGIRMQTIKAPRLAVNFERIASMGGVEAATQQMLHLPDQMEKFRFICTFADIGAKYGRNIWMDIYDPSFRTTIAVDDRIKQIAKAMGLEATRYKEVEAFFCRVAEDSGLEPWELDRLLYNFKDHFLDVITNAA